MSPAVYDWSAEADFCAPHPSTRLEDALAEVLDRHLHYGPLKHESEERRCLIYELAAVARPHALAELLHRLAQEATR